MLYETIFNIFNSGILLFWILLLIFPQKGFTQKIIAYPWVPLVIAMGYIYFLSAATGTFSADFTRLAGLTEMFQNANPRGVAAGWLHYLAFDFWVGCWMLKNSQEKGIKHFWMILPMLFTFMMGPVGILLYTLVLLTKKKLFTKDA
jgi:apolipoprotein N-acyltransferase